MDITLKKASDLARALGEAAEALPLRTIKSISIYAANPAEVVTSEIAAFGTSLETYMGLIDAQYTLRGLIGAANASSGVDALLTQRSALDAKIKKLNKLVEDLSDDEPASRVSAITSEIAALRTASDKGDRIGYIEKSVSCQTVSVAALRSQIAILKRQRADIADRVAGLNLNTRISIPESVVVALKANSLI